MKCIKLTVAGPDLEELKLTPEVNRLYGRGAAKIFRQRKCVNRPAAQKPAEKIEVNLPPFHDLVFLSRLLLNQPGGES
jgi:hypothetical protein